MFNCSWLQTDNDVPVCLCVFGRRYVMYYSNKLEKLGTMHLFPASRVFCMRRKTEVCAGEKESVAMAAMVMKVVEGTNSCSCLPRLEMEHRVGIYLGRGAGAPSFMVL